MSRAEQIVTDRKTMKELVAFMEEALKEGLTKDEITSQIDLMLDGPARKRLDRSLKEASSGRVLHLKTKNELLKTLHGFD